MKEIELTNGGVTIVDDEDFEMLNQFKWHSRKGYAARKTHGKTIFIHRVIADTPPGQQTDHKDRDRLNNQRRNLRVCSQRENNWNKSRMSKTSTYKGVSLTTQSKGKGLKKRRRYYAELTKDGVKFRKVFPGTPEGEVRAASFYNEMAIKHFGEFAVLNIIP